MSLLVITLMLLELSEIIGRAVRKQRQIQKKSMKSLAYESDMEYMQLSRIELGKINTTIYQLLKLCIALNIEISDLFIEIESNQDFKDCKFQLK